MLDRQFTWYGIESSIWLDRVFVEDGWLRHFKDLKIQVIGTSLSDHCPILNGCDSKNWNHKMDDDSFSSIDFKKKCIITKDCEQKSKVHETLMKLERYTRELNSYILGNIRNHQTILKELIKKENKTTLHKCMASTEMRIYTRR